MDEESPERHDQLQRRLPTGEFLHGSNLKHELRLPGFPLENRDVVYIDPELRVVDLNVLEGDVHGLAVVFGRNLEDVVLIAVRFIVIRCGSVT